jgi:hypothetical protein
VSTNKYDILWLLFFCGFLPLFDWYAFTGNPYFFSLVGLIPLTCVSLIVARGYTYNLKHAVLAWLLYCICSPITEFFCWDFNGPFCDLFKMVNLTPNLKSPELSKTEIEVSKTKICTRLKSIIFLSIMIGGLYYAQTAYVDMQDLLQSVIQFCIFNMAYLVLSVMNQIYVVYFDNTIITLHKKLNNEDVKESEKEVGQTEADKC